MVAESGIQAVITEEKFSGQLDSELENGMRFLRA